MAQIADRLWSVKDVSEYLGVPVHTLYAWRSAGTGPPGRRVGRLLRYRQQDVRDWVARCPRRWLDEAARAGRARRAVGR